MADDPRAPGSPSEAVAAVLPLLREAFAREVSQRLPRLLAAASSLAVEGAVSTAEALREVIADTHALGSSAAVVGEDVASRAARECEALFSSYAGLGALPAEATRRALRSVEAVAVALAGWLVDPSASGEV